MSEDFLELLAPWIEDQDGPLRARLSLAIRQAILAGRLPEGTRLPAERVLASGLHVSRPTISAVIDDLRRSGLIESRQGSGSWVAATENSPRPSVPFAERVSLPGVIDLASATAPDASAVPPFRLDHADLLAVEPANGFSPLGLGALRDRVAERQSRFVPTKSEDVIITVGAHQALALLHATIPSPGQAVLVEDTTYGGLVDLIGSNGCRVLAVPRDHEGPIPAALGEQLRRHQPSMVVLVSSVHSPTGSVTSPSRGAELASLLQAASPQTSVILDETYADLAFDPVDAAQRPLAQALGSNAIRVGTISKSVWTGMRVGWIAAPSSVIERLGRQRWKQFDLGPSVPGQLIACRVLDQLDEILPSRRRRLEERAEWMVSQMGLVLPRWQPRIPAGGLAMVVDIGQDGDDFAERAAQHGVGVLAGSASRADQQPCQQIRLCFDRPTDVLGDALSRLAGLVGATTQ